MPSGRRLLVHVARLVGVFLAAATLAYAADDLLRAAQTNDATVALAAIEDGVDVNGKSSDGTTALHWAVYNDNLALVERLIAAGELIAYRYDGFWEPMDTIKDKQRLDALANTGHAPWMNGGLAVDRIPS